MSGPCFIRMNAHQSGRARVSVSVFVSALLLGFCLSPALSKAAGSSNDAMIAQLEAEIAVKERSIAQLQERLRQDSSVQVEVVGSNSSQSDHAQYNAHQQDLRNEASETAHAIGALQSELASLRESLRQFRAFGNSNPHTRSASHASGNSSSSEQDNSSYSSQSSSEAPQQAQQEAAAQSNALMLAQIEAERAREAARVEAARETASKQEIAGFTQEFQTFHDDKGSKFAVIDPSEHVDRGSMGSGLGGSQAAASMSLSSKDALALGELERATNTSSQRNSYLNTKITETYGATNKSVDPTIAQHQADVANDIASLKEQNADRAARSVVDDSPGIALRAGKPVAQLFSVAGDIATDSLKELPGTTHAIGVTLDKAKKLAENIYGPAIKSETADKIQDTIDKVNPLWGDKLPDGVKKAETLAVAGEKVLAVYHEYRSDKVVLDGIAKNLAVEASRTTQSAHKAREDANSLSGQALAAQITAGSTGTATNKMSSTSRTWKDVEILTPDRTSAQDTVPLGPKP